VAERTGFRCEGELRNAEVDAQGKPRNVLLFSMIREDYEASR
jgi:RimJ/RimL family protein N-acetyltransferase